MSVRTRRKRARALVLNKPAVLRDEGTAETRAKLRPNPLADLPPELQRAAQNLRDTYLVVTQPVQPKTAALFERQNIALVHLVDSDGTEKAFRRGNHPGQLKRCETNIHWWGSLVTYRSWYEEMARRRLPTRPVVAVVADDKLPEEVLLPALGITTAEQIMAIVKAALKIFIKVWGERVVDFG